MALDTITKFILPISMIPENMLMHAPWLNRNENIRLKEVHIEDGEDDPLTDWIRINHPELAGEESFFIDLTA